MKSLLTAILALTLVPCASFATDTTTPAADTTTKVHTEVHKKEHHETTHEHKHNKKEDDAKKKEDTK